MADDKDVKEKFPTFTINIYKYYGILALIFGRIGNKVFSDRQTRYVPFTVLDSFFKRASTSSSVSTCLQILPKCVSQRGEELL